MVIVNGHRKQQIELYREPTNTVSFSNFIDPRLTYNKRCMAVLTGAPRTARGNIFTQLYKIYKLPYELGGTPFGQRAWSAPGPQSIRGHPELLQIILRNKIICNFTKDYATLKLLGLGKKPFRPLEQSHVQSVSRQGRPEPYKQTLQDTTQVNLPKQENYITKYYKLAQQIAFCKQKNFLEAN